MKKLRLSDLQDKRNGHILQDVLPGAYLSSGGLSFAKRGERSYTNDGPDGRDYHVHGDCEEFIILQGTGTMEINGEHIPVKTGDIVIVEPGEDHHFRLSEDISLDQIAAMVGLTPTCFSSLFKKVTNKTFVQ